MWATPCPKPQLIGPDRALITEILRHLPVASTASATSSVVCTRLVVEVAPEKTSFRLIVRAGLPAPRQRTVRSPRTAASLLTSWTTPTWTDLAWADLMLDQSTSIDQDPLESRLTAVPTRRPRPGWWWVAAVGVMGQSATLGGGAEAAWETGSETLRIGPMLRIQVDHQAGVAERAGAQTIESEVGVRGGASIALGQSRLALYLALTGAHRYVSPRSFVGPIPCAPIDPCELDEPTPENADAFHALTAWTELGLAVSFVVVDDVAVGVILGAGLNPGYITINAPQVPDSRGPGDRIRDLPTLPQWRAVVRFGVQWRS